MESSLSVVRVKNKKNCIRKKVKKKVETFLSRFSEFLVFLCLSLENIGFTCYKKMVSSSTFEDNASVETLVLAGITFGLAHVLSGPDHLCALAVIASGSSSDDSCDDDDDDENEDRDEEDCNDLNNEREDVNDDGKKKRRRETENAKDDEESQSVVVDGDDEYVIANTNDTKKKRFNDPKLLAANRKSQQRRDNFLLGVSWAFGHSFGLSLLVCVFFALKRELNINAIGDKIVGFTMIAIAFAAARGARKFRTREKAEREHVRDEEADGEGEEMAHLGDEIILEIDPTARTKVVASGSKEHEEMHLRREPHVHQRSASRERRLASGGGGCGNKEGFLEVKIVGVEKEERGENDEEKNVSSSGRGGITTTTKEKDEEKKDSRKKSAFLVGLVHGISGVSGILGVLPGVVLNSSAKSAAFIVSFLLCSTIAMTLFSVLFGETLRKAASFAGERGKGKSDGRKLASNVIVGANAFFVVGSFACGCAWLYLSFSGEGVDV